MASPATGVGSFPLRIKGFFPRCGAGCGMAGDVWTGGGLPENRRKRRKWGIKGELAQRFRFPFGGILPIVGAMLATKTSTPREM